MSSCGGTSPPGTGRVQDDPLRLARVIGTEQMSAFGSIASHGADSEIMDIDSRALGVQGVFKGKANLAYAGGLTSQNASELMGAQAAQIERKAEATANDNLKAEALACAWAERETRLAMLLEGDNMETGDAVVTWKGDAHQPEVAMEKQGAQVGAEVQHGEAVEQQDHLLEEPPADGDKMGTADNAKDQQQEEFGVDRRKEKPSSKLSIRGGNAPLWPGFGYNSYTPSEAFNRCPQDITVMLAAPQKENLVDRYIEIPRPYISPPIQLHEFDRTQKARPGPRHSDLPRAPRSYNQNSEG